MMFYLIIRHDVCSAWWILNYFYVNIFILIANSVLSLGLGGPYLYSDGARHKLAHAQSPL